MCFFRKQTIMSQLTTEQISSRLKQSNSFKGNINNKEFVIRENKFFSNKLLFPIVKGVIVAYELNSIIYISFEASIFDKIALSLFLFIILLIAICFGAFSSDILLTFTIICFDIVLTIIFLICYRKNCRRAYKKIRKLLSD